MKAGEKMNKLIYNTQFLPANAIAAAVGLCTLGNAFGFIGYTALRHGIMWFGGLVWLLSLFKIFCHFPVFKREYFQLMPASLYAALAMLTAILGGYLHDYLPSLGLFLWYLAFFAQAAHILFFTWRYVIKTHRIDNFIPTWFVTYVGILVPVVVGGKFGNPLILRGLMIYGFIITSTLVPLMVIRLVKKSLPPEIEMTQTIFLAPLSLTLVSYLTMAHQPKIWVVYSLYATIFITLVWLAFKMPSFLNRPFGIGFAALTFPLAIALVATYKTGQFLLLKKVIQIEQFYEQLFGILLFFTTIIIGFVIYQFVLFYLRAPVKKH